MWDETTDIANEAILDTFSTPVVFVVSTVRHPTNAVVTTPSSSLNSKSSRSDEYDLHGVDARRSEYELEILNSNIPAGTSVNDQVEAYGKVFVITSIDLPEDASTVMHLIDTGEVV
ncbi:MAG: hypothetical protein AB2747_05400 [Candidatus Thiodiazotropha taylori]